MDDTLQALERTCARLREGAVRAWAVSWRRLFHEPLLFKGCRQVLDRPAELATVARCHEHLLSISNLDYLSHAPLNEVGLLTDAPGYALALVRSARRLLATCYLAGLLRQDACPSEETLLPWAWRCAVLEEAAPLASMKSGLPPTPLAPYSGASEAGCRGHDTLVGGEGRFATEDGGSFLGDAALFPSPPTYGILPRHPASGGPGVPGRGENKSSSPTALPQGTSADGQDRAQHLFARLLPKAPSRPDLAAGRAGVLRWLGRKPAFRLRRVPILLFDEQTDCGEVAWLSFELFHDGLGELFPAPRLLRHFDPRWQEAFTQVRERLPLPPNVDVQWELSGAGSRLLFEGRSIQAACHVAVSLLLDRQLYESDSVISARVGPGGELLPVDGLIGAQGPGPKLHAARQAGCRRVLLSPADYHVLDGSSQPLEGLELVEVENVTAAREQVSGQVRLLQGYLGRLAQPANLIGAPPAYLGRRTVQQIYVEPDVVPLGRELQRQTGAPSEGVVACDPETPLPYGDVEVGLEERQPWEEELANLEREPGCRVVVLGPPGQGKSLLARMTVARMAEDALAALETQEQSWDQTPLPLLVPLRALTTVPGTAPSPRALLQEALAAGLTGLVEQPEDVPRLAALLAAQAETPRAWLFLDALDEVRDPESLLPFLNEAGSWFCRLIVTSRLDGYQPQRLPFPVREYRLANFLPEQSEEFMRYWFASGDAVATAARVMGTMRSDRGNPVSLARYLRDRCPRQVMQSPFLLTLLCAVVERHGLAGPSAIDRVTLYEQTLELLLGDSVQVQLWRPLLQEIAWAMLQRDAAQPSLPLDELLELVQHSDNRPPVSGLTPHNSSVRERAVAVCQELERPPRRLLVPLADRLTYVLPHRSFADFLAARHLAERINRHGWDTLLDGRGGERSARRLVSDRAWSPAWHELLLFLTGLLDQPRPLLRLLADPRRDDRFHHRLALAARCLLSLRQPLPEANAILQQAFALWAAHQQTGTEAAVPALARALAATGWLNADVPDLFPLDRLARRALDGEGMALAAVRLLRGSAARTAFLQAVVPHLRPDGPRLLRLRALAIVESLGSSAARGDLPRWLVCALADPDEELRRLALAAVRSLRRSLLHAGFVELLWPLLETADPEVRRTAVQALGLLRGARFPEDWQPQLAESFVRLLSDSNPLVQRAAGEAIWGLGPLALGEPFLVRLERSLDHPEPAVRLAVAWAGVGLGRQAARPALVRAWLRLLGDLDPGISQAVEQLRHRHSAARGSFWQSLAEPDPARQARPSGIESLVLDFQQQVLALLHQPRADLRRRAADVIGLLGEAAASDAVLGQLEQLLAHPEEPETRQAAAWALGELGPAAARPSVVAALSERLEDHWVLVREAAVQALERLGRLAVEDGVLTHLPALLQHRLPRLRHAAIEMLGGLGPEALVRRPQLLDVVLTLLADQRAPMVRWAAAQSLTALAPAVEQLPRVLTALAPLLRDPEPTVRRVAAETAGNLPAARLPAALRSNLLCLFEDGDAVLRQSAARSAGRLAARDRDLLDELVQRLGARDPRTVQAAAEALALVPLGQLSEAAIQGLLRLLGEEQAGTVRGAAARTLGLLMGQGLRIFDERAYRVVDTGGRCRREPLPESQET